MNMKLYNKLVETGYLNINGNFKIICDGNVFYAVDLIMLKVHEISYSMVKDYLSKINEEDVL